MPSYTWTAKNKAGEIVVKEIEAETASAAQAVLLARGYSDLVLKEDDVMATARSGFAKRQDFHGNEIKPTAAARLQHMADPTVTFWDVLRKGIKSDPSVLGLVVLVAAYEFYRGKAALALVALACLLGWFVYLIWRGLPSVYYRKLIGAADWYQWDEVLSLVKTLDRLGCLGLTRIPSSELTRYRAKAFAGTGQLEKALAEYQQCEGKPDCPTWLYKLFVGSLYTGAKQYDRGIEYNLMSLEEKATPTGWADLAYRYARYKRDAVKARHALAEANKSPTTDLVRPFHLRCLGVIGYLEGNYPAAQRDLEQAIQLVENVKWRPYKDGHLAISRAYLCCVLAKLGDFSGAKKCLTLARKYLVATKEDDLLAECRKLVGE